MASSSSGGYVSRYDVFLSFRGEDTRDSFTDHLYQELRRAGVYTFRDNDSISRGEDLKPEIERGIRESRASIIVLSARYATSRWCLDELCLILEQRKERDHFVLPIFYHVDPSHIRNQEGTFQINVVPNTKWTDGNVKRWKAALEKVGQMTGKVATSGPETIFLGEVVDIIKERLDLKQVYCQRNLVGMETRDKEINYWLEQSNSDIFAIWGMPGSGKTTLARHIVYSNWHKFESVSILQDIGGRSTEQLRLLQEKLIIDIIEGKERTIPSVWQGTDTIENALQRKKALIVLDDIVTKKQLDALIGTGIKTQSKIIITTRERNLSKWFQSTSWRCQEHEMKLLDDGDSLELLSLYAFEPNAPINDYEELMTRALVYCRGNPLALEVLGSSLNRGSQDFWESTLTSYEREVPGDLKNVLITSYNSLQQNIQKQLFLHIACFFIGEDKDYVEKILGPDYCAKSEIENLANSCLLSVSPNNKLMMHQLLQVVARTIVDDESHTHPGNRSRVWRDDESHNVLIKEKGSTNVKGLALDMEVLEKQRLALGKKQLSDVVNTKSFKKMDNLRLLKLNQLKLTGTCQNIFKKLRWLCWREFPLETIPSELDMENLVAIDMSCSKLKVFRPPDVLPLLQILNLTDSHNLVEVQDISRVPKLDTLVLENCRSLVHVCHTLGDLTSLTSLNLTGCENLFNRMQPQSIFPNSLKQLFLMDCNVNTHFPLPTYSFSNQPHLEYLNLAVNPCELLPSYTHHKNIRVLDLSSCIALKKLQCLPSKLTELYIFNCNSLEIVTFESHKFTLQEFRYEGCVNLSEVEDFFKIFPVATLTEADLGHMSWLRAYQDLEVCLVGDDDLTKGRTLCLQMLYEFNIMSISLPDIEKPNIIPENEYTSEDALLSFDIPESHTNRKLKGLNLTFKYTLQGDEWVWFAEIRTNNGVNLIYNAKVFGKPAAADEVGIWLSYWPIGELLRVGDEVNVSIIVAKGLKINGCGASLVYAGEEDEDESFEDSNKSIVENHESFEDANDFFEDNNEHADILGGGISGFQLSKGTYYLCRRDYSQLMEVGRLTPNWFRDLVGDTIDYTEIGGWRKTGRPDQRYRSYTKLKTDGCIIYGPHLNTQEESYKIEELFKSSLSKAEEYTSEFSKDATKDKDESANFETTYLFKAFDSDEIRESASSPHGDSAATKATKTLGSSFEVFVSFQGQDTRNSFTDHLYAALNKAGITTFLPDTEHIPRDEKQESQIKAQIEESKVIIIVISENYATSSSFLDELALILKQRSRPDHHILPLFYRVNPSDVRKQDGRFSLVVDNTSRWTNDNLQRWKEALKDVAAISGMVIGGETSETDVLRNIIDHVSERLNHQVDLPSDKTEEYTSESSKDATKDKDESANLETVNLSKAFDSDEIRESTSSPHEDSAAIKEIVLKVGLCSDRKKQKVMEAVRKIEGVESLAFDMIDGNLTVTGHVDPETVVACLKKFKLAATQILSVEELAKEPKKKK